MAIYASGDGFCCTFDGSSVIHKKMDDLSANYCVPFLQTFSMVIGRVLLFRMEESPKFLLNHNRHQEAAMVLSRIFHINHKEVHSDTFEENIETLTTRFTKPHSPGNTSGESSSESDSGVSPTEFNALRRPPSHLRQSSTGSSVSETKYRPLFLHKYRNKWQRKYRTAMSRLRPLLEPRFRLSTILIWAIWAMVAFAYTAFNVFYPKFLQEHGQGGKQPLQVVYKDTLIYAAAGVPGSVVSDNSPLLLRSEVRVPKEDMY